MYKRSEKAKQVLNKTQSFIITKKVPVNTSVFPHFASNDLDMWLPDKQTNGINLCEKCENVELKIQAIRNQVKFQNKYELIAMTMCPQPGCFYAKKCYKRNCANCGLDKIREEMNNKLHQCLIEPSLICQTVVPLSPFRPLYDWV